MNDRLTELLDQNDILCGIICRDPSPTDIELIALAGYHVVWIDLEHAPLATTRAVELCRTVVHLGMVPMVRIIELTRTHVQALLDGGYQVILLPNVRDAEQAMGFVRLGKFPPRGNRGVSTSAAGLDFSLGDDPRRKLEEANAATHLMVQFEGDRGFANLAEICSVEDIDMVTVGPGDWAISLGLFGKEAARLVHKVDKVLSFASKAGKITAMGVSSAEGAARYAKLGVRILFAGVDVNLRRRAFAEAISMFRTVTR